MKNTPFRTLALAVALAFAGPAVAQQAGTAAPAGTVAKKAATPGGMGVADVVTVTATVEAIDPATRRLTLKGPKGRTFPLVADASVKNFDQIRVGDKVVAKYAEAITVELIKGGDGIREMTQREGSAAAAPGQMPAGAVARETTVIANVWAIDRKKNVVSLRGPDGAVRDIKVHDPARLKDVKVGDQVSIRFVEALAVGVTRLTK
jgi:Cu/Ag efflux protein CusF